MEKIINHCVKNDIHVVIKSKFVNKKGNIYTRHYNTDRINEMNDEIKSII